MRHQNTQNPAFPAILAIITAVIGAFIAYVTAKLKPDKLGRIVDTGVLDFDCFSNSVSSFCLRLLMEANDMVWRSSIRPISAVCRSANFAITGRCHKVNTAEQGAAANP